MKRDLDRLYELLPAIYRQRDAEQGEPLRALLQVISEQVNVVEDDISQLYANWFIETCEDWVVPYIADLVGFRPVEEAGEAGEVATAQGVLRNKFLVPRREVADTIGNRRRKGTVSLLELLAADVAGWPARAVEFYRLLAYAQHLNHLHAERGLTADLRKSEALELVDGPFDRGARSADVRRVGSQRSHGRYNVPGVGLFVWRLAAYPVTRAPAFCIDRKDNHYTFSVLGTNTQLFTRPVPEPDLTHLAETVNVPAPISRRAFEERTADYYGRGKSLCIYRDGPRNRPVPLEQIVPADLSHWAYSPRGRQVAVDPVLGRIAFSGSTLDDPPEGVWVSYHYGFSGAVGGGEYERQLRPAAGRRVYRVSQQRRLRGGAKRAAAKQAGDKKDGRAFYATITEALDAWERDGRPNAVIQIEDSGSYTESLRLSLRPGERLEIRAANGKRPHIFLLNRHVNRPDYLSISGDTPAADHRRREREEDEEEGAARDVVRAAAVPEWEEGVTEVEEVAGEAESSEEEESGGEEAESAGVTEYEGDDYVPLDDERAEYGERVRQARYDASDSTDAEGGDAGQDTQQHAPRKRRRPSRLTLDGLLIEGRSVRVEGDLGQLVIRHCTLVPGWSLDQHCKPQNEEEPSIEMVETDAQLVVERSIVGTIMVNKNVVTDDPLPVQITDSVLDSTGHTLEALSGPDGRPAHALLTIRRSTVFGTVLVHAVRLAENSIFDTAAGSVQVARTQTGCVRFCYVPPDSRTPRRYNCQPDLAAAGLKGDAQARAYASVRPQLNSTRYGTPDYCQLAETCPAEITRGADDESEMGVFHDLFQPQREANLRARLDEYTPAGMDAGIIFAT
jgi:hypothetical protein